MKTAPPDIGHPMGMCRHNVTLPAAGARADGRQPGVSCAPCPPARRAGPALALCLALCLPLPQVPARAGETSDLATEVLAEVNRYRASHGLAPLAADARLQAIAQAHSQAMAQEGRLSHGGFQQRFDRSGARLCVENLAAGTLQPARIVAAWRRSPEHHRNLLESRVQVAGVAAAGSVVSLLACRFDGP
jgi:uncharacterized protein YkwD